MQFVSKRDLGTQFVCYARNVLSQTSKLLKNKREKALIESNKHATTHEVTMTIN
ncbi:hypothetical protein QTP88_004981 [Uroleucon formosanum]